MKSERLFELLHQYRRYEIVTHDLVGNLLASYGWRPIAEAPTDSETRVDVWAVNRMNGLGFRIPDCRRAFSNKCWMDSEGKWFTGRHYFDSDDERCYDPTLTDETSIVVTHFMFPPETPSAG